MMHLVDRNPPVVLHAPQAPAVPVVLDSPHSGTDYPADFDFSAPMEAVRMCEDTWVEALYAAAPGLGATLVAARFPRAYIDVNRALDEVDPELLAQPWDGPLAPGPKVRLGLGLVWRLARGGVPLYDRQLSVAEVRARIDRCYRPYHEAVATAIDRCHARFGAVWHLNCHSMPARGDELSTDPGRERADFVLGDRDGTSCEPDFTTFVEGFLTRRGYSVAINDPYKGVELVRRHGRPSEGRHSLQVEVKRTLYMDERTLVPHAGFDRLAAHLALLVAGIAEHATQRAGALRGPV